MTQVASHRRHDRSEQGWGLLELRLPDCAGSWGSITRDNRSLSTRFSGSCAPVRHGVTCRRITVTGAIRTVRLAQQGCVGKTFSNPD